MSESGLARVPVSPLLLSAKEFTTDQEVRWCPGCGDYAILAAFQHLMPELGIRRENTVVISGIGCSSRLPYYFNSYGLHSIHGRALTLATGLAMTRPDLAVFVVTGDGDALSIGGNHLVHALRRNVNLTILLFNNRIYGLTKGQYSPTSEMGKVTKSSPAGSLDRPVNAVSLALGAEATFVARTMASDRAHLSDTLRAAAMHRGSSLVEIYQNCPIFNDGAFGAFEGPDADEAIIPLVHGKPIIFASGQSAVIAHGGRIEVAKLTEANRDKVVVHDAHRADPSLAFALSRLSDAGVITQSPIGIFRDIDEPAYDDLARSQLPAFDPGADQRERAPRITADELAAAIAGTDTWEMS